jgi:transposase-like protein
VLAVALFKIGLAARTFQAELGVTDTTAWSVLDRIRQAVGADPVLRRCSGEVEIDETDSGGGWKGKHGRGAAGKTPIVAIRQRGGRVRSVVVPALDVQTVQTVIRQHVRRGGRVATDGLNSSQGLAALGYRHVTVDHTDHFVAPHGVHTQGIKSHWAHTKPVQGARHRKITPRHFPKHLAEADFKRNAIHEPDFIHLVLQRRVSHTFYTDKSHDK